MAGTIAPTSRATGRAAAVERLADQVAAAAAGCPGVARLAGGPVATYLPHRVVPGVVVDDGALRVAVVARYGPPMAEVARQVRAAVRAVAPGRPVDVVIDNIDLPADGPPGGRSPDS
jgi:hypothetical protein